ncbi:hypothetical protein GUJ93_ZPchr0012g20540 [Zizania palustris]|uniref:Protein TIFY n=1 Tax=Zizania palustris TaxID=103762 RepID=A0A8J5WLY9_ZIZPA|nr:hypothetical protein GUJ93_ZPchr0012g20540 [Zizania palustris]
MTTAYSSRFAITCGLLRQYMREQQQQHQQTAPVTSFLGMIAAAAAAAAEKPEEEDDRTMQLFPPRAGVQPSTRPASQERAEMGTKAPLTIFYDGRVVVFEDVPAEKAMELIQLAGSESSPAPVAMAAPVPATQTAALSDIPIARKVSLQQFLQKRKQRIATSNPYQKVAMASPAPEKSLAVLNPWLAL